MTALARMIALVAVVVTLCLWATPPPADALSPGAACSLAGWVSTLASTVCRVGTHAGRLLQAGKKLLGGHLGSALNALTGGGATTVTRAAAATAGLAAIAAAAAGGARYALRATAQVINGTTRPDLGSAWFASSYWRVAGISTLLTLPFLFAASLQALIRSDLTLLARAAFGYLPLALVGVGVAVPLTMLLLAASDEMSSIVTSASGDAGAAFIARAGVLSVAGGGVFLSILIGVVTAAGALTLWGELLIRSAAVYVIVLMLPLFFAAMVWPARRVWAVRAVELLVALILSKFAIVAVLSLGGMALGHTLVPGAARFLTGVTLVLVAAFSPWALMRLLPLHELAGAAAGGLRGAATRTPLAAANAADGFAATVSGPAHEPPDRLPELTQAAGGSGADDDEPPLGEAGADPGGGGDGPSGGEPAGPGGDIGPSGETTGPGGDIGPPGEAPTSPGGEASAAAGEGQPATPAAVVAEERLPGLPKLYQAANRSWSPVELNDLERLRTDVPPEVADDDEARP